MADFRRWILALAMLALVLGSASAQVSGPAITCSASASVAPTLRAEGFTELVGDILLTCTANPGAVPTPVGSTVPQADVSVTLSAPLTTKTYGSYVANTPTDALLFVDDAQPGNQQPCTAPQNPVVACAVAGFGPGSFNSPAAGRYNVFQAVLGGPGQSSNPNIFYSVTFLGVPVDPPVTTRTYRITNIRINATGAGVGSSQAVLFPINATVTSSSSTSISIPNPQVVVGYVANGLTSTPASLGDSFLQCQNYPQQAVGSITFTELFATAFKVLTNGVQNSPGTVYYSESGLEIPGFPSVPSSGITGIANTGTELQATITNIPANVSVYVDNYAVSTASVPGNLSDATLVSPAATCGAAPLSACVASTPQLINPNGETSVTVVWEVTDTNSSAIDSLTFVIYASVTGNPTLPIGPPTTVSGSFYPWASAGGWVNGDPIPEFNSSVNLSLNPVLPSLFVFSPCQTILLFPYVTDSTGFDTGIAISNTGLDTILGAYGVSAQTQAQMGTCSVAFYSGGGPATNIGSASTTPTPGFVNSNVTYTGNGTTSVPPINSGTANEGLVLPGQTWAFPMSGTDMGYGATPTYGSSGYAIAVCNFQYAHGYSFVSDTDVRNFAAAYLALIIPDAPRTPVPFVCSALASACVGANQPGEQLVH